MFIHSKQVLAGALALAVFAQSASAESVVMTCTITKSDFEEFEPGKTRIFKIGDGAWQEWFPEYADWRLDYCARFRLATNVTCTFTTKELSARGLYFSEPGQRKITAIIEASIDRKTGSYLEKLFVSGDDFPTQNKELTGVCAYSEEPNS